MKIFIFIEKQSDLCISEFVVNLERFDAIRYSPILYTKHLVTMITMNQPKAKDISTLLNIFDIYSWLALAFSLFFLVLLMTKFLNQNYKDVDNNYSKIFYFINSTLSLLEPILCRTSK